MTDAHKDSMEQTPHLGRALPTRRAPTGLSTRVVVGGCTFFLIPGFFLAHLSSVEGSQLGSIVFNVVLAGPAFVALVQYLGPLRGLCTLAGLSTFGILIEGFGVVTGIPYGEFHYGTALGPLMFDAIPYLLPLSYVPLVIGAATLAGLIGRQENSSSGRLAPHRILGTAAFLIIIDLVLDPNAVRLGFWRYPAGGPFYGVPLENYIGWLISGLVAAIVLWTSTRRQAPTGPPLPGLLESTLWSMCLWMSASLSSGMLVPALIALLLVITILRRRKLLLDEHVIWSARATEAKQEAARTAGGSRAS